MHHNQAKLDTPPKIKLRPIFFSFDPFLFRVINELLKNMYYYQFITNEMLPKIKKRSSHVCKGLFIQVSR